MITLKHTAPMQSVALPSDSHKQLVTPTGEAVLGEFLLITPVMVGYSVVQPPEAAGPHRLIRA
jgi:hypothetical protein